MTTMLSASAARHSRSSSSSSKMPGLLLFAGTIFITVSLLLLNRLECLDVKELEQIFPAKNNNTKPQRDDWDHPFIHILNTRFMQQQGDLVHLARARLKLFETFCLNSILGQDILAENNEQSLLWIIKVDPQLDETILKELLSLVRPYPFIYVVASNVNFGIGTTPGGWRGGEAGQDVLDSKVFSGDMVLFQEAHAARTTRAILDTRLDADDGLHAAYLSTIQKDARRKLRWSKNQTFQHRQRWKYYCPQNRLDWNPPPPFLATNDTDYGLFVAKKSPRICITAGITLGISIGPEEADIPRFPHHQLYSELRGSKEHPDCGGPPNAKCLRMMEDPVLGAIRSRTPTSAGMRGVTKDEGDYEENSSHSIPAENKHLLHALRTVFHVNLSQIIEINRFIQENFQNIVADNLRGQCTHGHSCKNSTKEALESWLKKSGTEGTTMKS
jgi:hypothetical protein